MATKPLTDEQCREALDAVAKFGTSTAAAVACGMPAATFQHRLSEARRRFDIKVHRVATHEARMSVMVENGVVIVFSDAHYQPGRASTAHRALLRMIKELKPIGIVGNGDLFDGASISRHPRIGWDSKPSVKEELDAVDERLTEVEKIRRAAWLVWLLGNHDARYETFLAANAPQYQSVNRFSLKDHFPLWLPAWRLDINPGTIGHTIVKHRGNGGIHASRNNTLKAGVNFVSSHLHSPKVAPNTNARGTCYGVDTGCLADVNSDAFVDYTEDGVKDWRSGFAVLTFKDYRLLYPELVQVYSEDGGVVEFRGKEIVV